MKSAVKKVLFAIVSLTAVFFLFAVTAYAEDYGNFYYSKVEPEEGQTFEAYNEIAGYKNSDDVADTVVNVPSAIEDIPVTRIAANAFYGNDKITDVVIPDTVTIISNAAFYNCTALKVIIIPDSVTYIGESAFQGCTALEYVIIGNGVKAVGDIAFKGCSALKAVEIGSAVEEIGSGAFFGCSALKDIYVPDSVKSIGSLAFGFEQNGDEETPVSGFAFRTNKCEALNTYVADADGAAFNVTENVAPCADDAHTVQFENIRKATDSYTGVDIGLCSVCKNIVTKENTEITADEDGSSAVVTLVLVLIALVVLVVIIAVYVKKSKVRRAAAIAAYKEGKPMPDAEQKAAEEAKLAEKEAKKKEKQLAKLRSYGIIDENNNKLI